MISQNKLRCDMNLRYLEALNICLIDNTGLFSFHINVLFLRQGLKKWGKRGNDGLIQLIDTGID